MASGHLVTNLDLSLLSNIYLGKTNNSCRQFIADGDVVFLALVYAVNLLVLDYIIVKQLLDAVVFIILNCKIIRVYIKKK
jgi:hypothetical protein